MSECISHPNHSGGECMDCKVEELEKQLEESAARFKALDKLTMQRILELALERIETHKLAQAALDGYIGKGSLGPAMNALLKHLEATK